jgi:hypothetical protein
VNDDVHTIVLPNGHRIAVNDGEKPRDAMLRHTAASLAEGFCPYHGERLTADDEGWLMHPYCDSVWKLDTRNGEPSVTWMSAWAYEGRAAWI